MCSVVAGRDSEAWEVGFHHDYDSALGEGVFGDADMLLSGLNCCGDMEANKMTMCRYNEGGSWLWLVKIAKWGGGGETSLLTALILGGEWTLWSQLTDLCVIWPVWPNDLVLQLLHQEVSWRWLCLLSCLHSHVSHPWKTDSLEKEEDKFISGSCPTLELGCV